MSRPSAVMRESLSTAAHNVALGSHLLRTVGFNLVEEPTPVVSTPPLSSCSSVAASSFVDLLTLH
jgi:hypothetical protein